MTQPEMKGVAAPVASADRAWQDSFDADADAIMAAAISKHFGDDAGGEVAAEGVPDEKAPPPPKTAAELAALLEQANADAAEEKGDEAEEPAAEPEEDKSATAAILRMLEQEKGLRAERDAFKAEREAFEAEKQSWQEKQARQDVISAEALRRVLMTDPSKLLGALGIEPTKVSQLLIAAQLGDKAPAELRATVERAQWEARVAELETKLQQRDSESAARAETDKVRVGATEYVTKGVSKDCPTVAAVVKVDRARVEGEIFDEIVRDAAARAHREPNGKPISFEEATRRVEKRWAALSAAFKSQPGQSATTDGSTNATSGTTNAPKAATPSIAPSRLAPKAPSSPTPNYGLDPDWEQEAELALKESLAKVRRPAR